MNISIVLNHEHFDGFNTDDNVKLRYKEAYYNLNVPIINETQYCHPHGVGSDYYSPSNVTFLQWSDIDTISDNKIANNSIGIWARSSNELSYRYIQDRSPGLVSKQEFVQCIERNNIHIVGDSHQRYLWDYLANEYFKSSFDSKRLIKDHRDASVPNLFHHAVFFVPEIIRYIKKISSCPVNKKFATHMIEFGAWDLRFASVRYILRNSNFVPAFIEALRDFNIEGNITSLFTRSLH